MSRATLTGFKDGWDQPYDFNVGMSYESAPGRQLAYDLASRLGQLIRRTLNP